MLNIIRDASQESKRDEGVFWMRCKSLVSLIYIFLGSSSLRHEFATRYSHTNTHTSKVEIYSRATNGCVDGVENRREDFRVQCIYIVKKKEKKESKEVCVFRPYLSRMAPLLTSLLLLYL